MRAHISLGLFLYIVVSGLIGLTMPSVTALGAEAGEDIVDCSTTTDRFEMVLCSNHGAFDLLNHVHQMFAFAPDSEASKLGFSAFRDWVQSIRTRCMAGDLRLASDCIYDLASGDEARTFLTEVELLYANESDIEGDEECDGCQESAETPQEITGEENGAGTLAVAGSLDPKVGTENVAATYKLYLVVKACLDAQLTSDDLGSFRQRLAEMDRVAGENGLDTSAIWSRLTEGPADPEMTMVLFTIGMAGGITGPDRDQVVATCTTAQRSLDISIGATIASLEGEGKSSASTFKKDF